VAASPAQDQGKLFASILVVDADPASRHAVMRDLRGYGYEARSAGSFEEALQSLREHRYDVLLTDVIIDGGDGLALIESLREVSPGTRPVLMSEHSTARESQQALDAGAVRVLSKPFETDEMLHAVERAAEYAGGFLASLHGMSVVDTLQMLNYSRRSLTLSVLGGVPAAIYMRDGQLVHAEYGERRGELALAAILKIRGGTLQTSSLVPVKQSISREFQTVLLDQLSKLDEQVRDSQLPDLSDLLDATFTADEAEPPPAPESPLPESPLSGSPLSESPVPTERSAAVCPFAEQPRRASGERSLVRPREKRRTMEKIDIACERVVRAVDGGVACGVIDLDGGALLGIFNSRDYSEEQNELVAEAAVELFRGPNVMRIEAMVRAQRGDNENSEHYFEEIQLTSKHNLHFAKTLKGGRAVIMLVTRRSTSLGMGWAQLKAAIPVLERLIP
jgi:CheY-like chemotaxis protein